MKIGFIGDMHGETDFVHKLLQFEKPEFALQVGDYMKKDGIEFYRMGYHQTCIIND